MEVMLSHDYFDLVPIGWIVTGPPCHSENQALNSDRNRDQNIRAWVRAG